MATTRDPRQKRDQGEKALAKLSQFTISFTTRIKSKYSNNTYPYLLIVQMHLSAHLLNNYKKLPPLPLTSEPTRDSGLPSGVLWSVVNKKRDVLELEGLQFLGLLSVTGPRAERDS
ncbi:unnamed protein product [Fusarium venenatum]|uniref:Uncharacterized protein n=1 Tax=Fusarium venenatum TaxID=56646 RepID=A0A2L2TL68_9HYPO|nr:uncharacterized protein FVRRES_00418 [Fusarium venenatum]CEI63906.1 unnamed protein product [Fusarium venenatum]